MDEDWEALEVLGLSPLALQGLVKGLAGDRETWPLSAWWRGAEEQLPTTGAGNVCFLPEEPWEREKRIDLNI